jgi:hypothetical protein
MIRGNYLATAILALPLAFGGAASAQTPASKPNIVVIMADDVGIWNISAYHRGMMGGSTPNIDRIARAGAVRGADGNFERDAAERAVAAEPLRFSWLNADRRMPRLATRDPALDRLR